MLVALALLALFLIQCDAEIAVGFLIALYYAEIIAINILCLLATPLELAYKKIKG